MHDQALQFSVRLPAYFRTAFSMGFIDDILQLTWHTIGPILAQNYTVIAVDIRDMGQSTNPNSYEFSSSTAAEHLKGVLDCLNISQTDTVVHDKGNGK